MQTGASETTRKERKPNETKGREIRGNARIAKKEKEFIAKEREWRRMKADQRMTQGGAERQRKGNQGK